MNRYFRSRLFRVQQNAQGNAVPFCLQQPPAAQTALRLPLQATDPAHPQRLMSGTVRQDRDGGLNRRQHRLIQIT
jgi:hypothetical protein